MNTMLFVIATIGFPENLFSSLVEHTVTNLVMYDHTSHTYLDVLSLKILAKVLISSKMLCLKQTYSNYCLVNYIHVRSVYENNLMCLNFS